MVIFANKPLLIMNAETNPFSPGAGAPPPELVGRDGILDQARVLLARIRARRPAKSLLLVGLRGVGKTVLLGEIERRAITDGYRTLMVEAHEGKSLAALLAPGLRRLLYDLDRIASAGHKAKRGLAVLKSFLGGVKFTVGDIAIGLDVEPEVGAADSGDLEADFPNLLEAVGEAAAERNVAVVLLIDEIQYFSAKELSALIMGLHRMQQRSLPLTLIGAGLPILPALAGDSKSYAERLFDFPGLNPLPPPDARRALADPVAPLRISFETAALDRIVSQTEGYPYFLQEWGYQAWNHATGPVITAADIARAAPDILRRLDQNFFRVRFDRLTPREKEYLRAMAELGPDAHRSGAIADVLGVKVNSLGPVRAKLIEKGMIYSPEHGQMAFTVPLFDAFMRRAIPELPVKRTGKA